MKYDRETAEAVLTDYVNSLEEVYDTNGMMQSTKAFLESKFKQAKYIIGYDQFWDYDMVRVSYCVLDSDTGVFIVVTTCPLNMFESQISAIKKANPGVYTIIKEND